MDSEAGFRAIEQPVFATPLVLGYFPDFLLMTPLDDWSMNLYEYRHSPDQFDRYTAICLQRSSFQRAQDQGDDESLFYYQDQGAMGL